MLNACYAKQLFNQLRLSLKFSKKVFSHIIGKSDNTQPQTISTDIKSRTRKILYFSQLRTENK